MSLQGISRSRTCVLEEADGERQEKQLAIDVLSRHPIIPRWVALQRCPLPFHRTGTVLPRLFTEATFLSGQCLKNSFLLSPTALFPAHGEVRKIRMNHH
jgi:hypothetical protein